MTNPNNSNFQDAKDIIYQGIDMGINFKELRELLPGWRKRPLQSLIFDVMAELGMDNVPFPGMVVRPRLSRKPLQISSDGMLCVQQLLEEKGYESDKCFAFAHIGDKKITLTIRPGKINQNKEEQNNATI